MRNLFKVKKENTKTALLIWSHIGLVFPLLNLNKESPNRKILLKSVEKSMVFVKIIWVEVFKNRPSKICGRQPLKIFTWSILEYLDPFENYYGFISFFLGRRPNQCAQSFP